MDKKQKLSDQFLTNSADIDIEVDAGEYRFIVPETSAYTYEEIMSLLGIPKSTMPQECLYYYCNRSGIYKSGIRYYPAKNSLRMLWGNRVSNWR